MNSKKHTKKVFVQFQNQKDKLMYEVFYEVSSNSDFKVGWLEQFDTGDWYPKITYPDYLNILPQTKIRLLSKVQLATARPKMYP